MFGDVGRGFCSGLSVMHGGVRIISQSANMNRPSCLEFFGCYHYTEFITGKERKRIMAGKKITSDTIVKKVVGKPSGRFLEFGKFTFTPGQTEKLMDMAESKARVTVTIVEVEPKLAGT